jgi:hypothetical protein
MGAAAAGGEVPMRRRNRVVLPEDGPTTLRVDLPGLDERMRQEIQERVDEFDREHLHSAWNGGPGWVPRITGRDYAIAVAINLVIVVWMIVAFMG